MGILNYLNHTGHQSLSWDTDDSQSVQTAESTYKQLTEGGYQAFRINSDGSTGEQITSFNPSYGEIALVPPMQGG